MRKKKYNKYIIGKEYSIMFVNYKNIVLSVLIDNEDIEKVISVGAWHAIYDKTLQTPSFYIAHRFGNKKEQKGVLKLHRFVTNCTRSKVVDHINHNTLDNRKINLRECTHFENQQNLRSKKTEQTGVFFRKRVKNNKVYSCWVANISKDKKKITKNFKTKEEAISWRKNQELLLYGKGA